MKSLKSIFHMIKYNFITLILFELLYKVLSVFVVLPAIEYSFNGMMKLMDVQYLTKDNVAAFLQKPQVIIYLIILLFLVMVYAMFDLIALITIFDMSKQKIKIGLLDTIKYSLKRGVRTFKPSNITLIVLVILMMPFLNLGTATGVISVIKLPEFVTDYIATNRTLIIIVFFGIAALTYVFLRWIYAIHFYVITGHSFKHARRNSVKLSQGRKLRILLFLVITQAVYMAAYWGILMGGLAVIRLIQYVTEIMAVTSVLSAMVWVFAAVLLIIYFALATPVSYAVISSMFYNRIEELGYEPEHIEFEPHRVRKHTKIRVLVALIYIGIIATGSYFTYGIYNGTYTMQIEYVRTMEITAHRGASRDYPENTMAAFRGAAELNADWIELDVQMTKDGVPIISHDANMKRTTGVNKDIWNMTAEEVSKLDAGSHFSPEFAGEKVPTLEEVVKWAKGANVRLNIELKPTGHEEDFEQAVVDIIKKYSLEDRCCITSMKYTVLERVKALDENIRTVYVLTFAYGDVTKLSAADNFSVEASSITANLVKKIHNQGKELLAWTVNKKSSIESMIEKNVDNIVTDNITLARQLVYESKTSDFINEYLKLLDRFYK